MPHRVVQQTPQGLEKVTKWYLFVSIDERPPDLLKCDERLPAATRVT